MKIYINSTELYIRTGKASSKRNTTILSSLFNKDTLRDTQKFVGPHINNKSKRFERKNQIMRRTIRRYLHANHINKVSIVLNEESLTLTISMKKFANYSLVSFPFILFATIFGMNCGVRV
ncbi:hypothetical protein ACTA71_011434 [Dictyostelium dimigraforme]